MQKNRTALGVTALVLAAAAVGLTSGRPAEEKKVAEKKVAEKGVKPKALEYMYISANGQRVRVYPADPIQPYRQKAWLVETPLVLTSFKYDKDRSELVIGASFGYSAGDEAALRKKLAAIYADAGAAVDPDSLSILPLELAAYSLSLRYLETKLLLFSTDRPERLNRKTLAFTIPDMMPGGGNLRRWLSTHPEAVELVLEPAYRFETVKGLTITRRVLAAAWEKVKEKIAPKKLGEPKILCLDTEAELELTKRLSEAAETVIEDFGLCEEEKAQALKEAKEQLDKLKLPTTAPLTGEDLLEHAQGVFTVKGTRLATERALSKEDLTKLSEERSNFETVAKTAEKITDTARKHVTDERTFHKELTKFKTEFGTKAKILDFIDGQMNFHLSTETEMLSDKQRKELREARDFALNKSTFSATVMSSYRKSAEGNILTSTHTPALVRLKRVSMAAVAAQGEASVTIRSVRGSEVVVLPVAVELRATPTDDDVVRALKQQLDGITKRAEKRVLVNVHKNGQVDIEPVNKTIPVKDMKGSIEIPAGETQDILVVAKVGGIRPYPGGAVSTAGVRFDLEVDGRAVASSYVDFSNANIATPAGMKEVTLFYLISGAKNKHKLEVKATPMNKGVHLGLSNGPTPDSTRSLLAIALR